LKVFVQVGSVQDAREAVEDGTDVLVVQGTDAGGHQRAQGASLITLLPEVVDMLAEEFKDSHVAVVATGGIMDGRGIAAAQMLGKIFPIHLCTLLTTCQVHKVRLWEQEYVRHQFLAFVPLQY
jgi:collagenase-like PrtC family protease